MKTYVLYGKPIALKRPRHTRSGITYDPQKDEKARDAILLRRQRGTAPQIEDSPIDVSLTFYMPIPKSYPKKKLKELNVHTKRPDLDNLIKYILDVAQGVLFKDDSKICSIYAEKVYDKDQRTELTIMEIENESEKGQF